MNTITTMVKARTSSTSVSRLAPGTGVLRRDTLYRALNFKGWKVIAMARFARSSSSSISRGTRAANVSPKRSALQSTPVGNSQPRRAFAVPTTAPTSRGLPAPWKRKSVIGAEEQDVLRGHGLLEWGPLLQRSRAATAIWELAFSSRERPSSTGRKPTSTYFALSHAKSGEAGSYWIGAGWTASGDFHDFRDWWTYLDQWA